MEKNFAIYYLNMIQVRWQEDQNNYFDTTKCVTVWARQKKCFIITLHLYSLSNLKLPLGIFKCTCNAKMMKLCRASKSEFYANVVFYCQFAGRGKDGHSGQEPARSKKVLALQILLNFLDVLIFGRMF